MKNMWTVTVILLIALSSVSVCADDYIQSVGLIHMDSEVSGGEHTISMLGSVAKNAGADVAFLTDHDTQKATYGIWPLRNFLKVSHSRASIRNYGIQKYLDEIKQADRNLDDFLYLPGVEAVPYYSWGRSTFSNLPLISHLHRHILVLGIDSAEQIEYLPSIETGYPRQYTRKSLMKLLWLIPLFISFFLYKPPDRTVHYSSWMKALFSEELNYLAMGLLVFSVIFLFDAFPFNEPIVDQYQDDNDVLPYQTLIDYVNRQGGLTFWAHPEAMYDETISTEKGNPFVSAALRSVLSDGIEIKTEPYYKLLNSTHGYTGFAIFFEGHQMVGKPNGVWDGVLTQFCEGLRQDPVFAISELDMEEGTDPETASESQTVFLVREKTPEEYLEALRKGRVYCYRNNLSKWVTIQDYSVSSGGLSAISGELVPFEENARMTLDLDIKKHDLEFNVIVINNNRVIANRKINKSTHLTVDLAEPMAKMGYVRVVMYQGSSLRIATNPIFYLNTNPVLSEDDNI